VSAFSSLSLAETNCLGMLTVFTHVFPFQFSLIKLQLQLPTNDIPIALESHRTGIPGMYLQRAQLPFLVLAKRSISQYLHFFYWQVHAFSICLQDRLSNTPLSPNETRANTSKP
jgi:hypothetical protein